MPGKAGRPGVEAAPEPVLGGRTIGLWTSSAGVSLLLILVAVAVQAIETGVVGVHGRGRLVAIADEFVVRVVGFGHHLVAAFFLLCSPRARSLRGTCWLAGLLAGGVLISVAFAELGGRRNPLGLALYIVMFLAHAFHDEIFFFREHARRAGRGVHDPAGVLTWLQVAATGVVGAALVPALALAAYPRARHWLSTWLPFGHNTNTRQRAYLGALLRAGWPVGDIVALLALPFVAAVAIAAVRLVAMRPGFVRAHAPVVAALAGSVALTLASGALGLWLVDLVILMHFVSWFLFTTEQLGRPGAVGPRTTPPGLGAWLRGTRRGFCLLHGGCVLAVVALIAVDHYVVGGRPLAVGGWTMPDPLRVLLDADAFYYWTIAHVMLSLMPKGLGRRRLRPATAVTAS